MEIFVENIELGLRSINIAEVLNKCTYYDVTTITESDKKVLQDAIEFIRSIKEGQKIVETLELKANAVELTYLYRNSIKAFSQLRNQHRYGYEDYKDFKKFIEILENVLRDILKGKKPSEEKIMLAKNFFHQIARNCIRTNAAMIMSNELRVSKLSSKL